jgi:hypothetical protein
MKNIMDHDLQCHCLMHSEDMGVCEITQNEECYTGVSAMNHHQFKDFLSGRESDYGDVR